MRLCSRLTAVIGAPAGCDPPPSVDRPRVQRRLERLERPDVGGPGGIVFVFRHWRLAAESITNYKYTYNIYNKLKIYFMCIFIIYIFYIYDNILLYCRPILYIIYISMSVSLSIYIYIYIDIDIYLYI